MRATAKREPELRPAEQFGTQVRRVNLWTCSATTNTVHAILVVNLSGIDRTEDLVSAEDTISSMKIPSERPERTRRPSPEISVQRRGHPGSLCVLVSEAQFTKKALHTLS